MSNVIGRLGCVYLVMHVNCCSCFFSLHQAADKWCSHCSDNSDSRGDESFGCRATHSTVASYTATSTAACSAVTLGIFSAPATACIICSTCITEVEITTTRWLPTINFSSTCASNSLVNRFSICCWTICWVTNWPGTLRIFTDPSDLTICVRRALAGGI